jgi:dihydrofolate reductase
MAILQVFNTVSIDGYFSDGTPDMRWAHPGNEDTEWNAYVEANVKSDGLLLFGRATYDLMASFWPTAAANEMDPVIANAMNAAEKIVFSRKMKKADWENTRVINDNIISAIKKLKAESTKTLVILGSGNIIAQLVSAGIIDRYQIVISPIILGRGRTMFEGVEEKINLKLESTRAFKNGNVLLDYRAK